MNYGNIKFNDIADGPGIRLSLFVSGCRNHCPGCFNKETWDFGYGQEFTDETIFEILDELKKPQYQGLTILGGDPLEPENLKMVTKLCDYIKVYFHGEKNIWLYTGYTLENKWNEIHSKGMPFEKATLEDAFNLMNLKVILCDVDVIVDGPFIQEQKDISLKFRGSRNQRIIDMNETRKAGTIVLLEEK